MSRSPMPSSVEINSLIALYNAGRYAELESRLRVLVYQHPDCDFGWKLLGGTLQMQGKDALPAFQKTAELMPDDAEAHYNLGIVLKSAGRLDDALTSYRRALKIKPDYAEAHSNLGNVLKDLGRLGDALSSYRRALEIRPNSAEAHNSLGTALKDLKQLDDAVVSYRQALAIKPDYADAFYNLGNALKELGQLDEAVKNYRQAIKIKPDLADAHNNLGAALHELEQFDEAVASYRRVIELNSGFAEAHNNLGAALKGLGQLDIALTSYRKAIELNPNYAEAHNNLGSALKDLGELSAAEASYRRSLEIKPDFAEAHFNLGDILRSFGQLDDAEASYHRAVEIKPDYASALINLGNIYKDTGRLDEAIAYYRRAVPFDENDTKAYRNLLYTLYFHPNFDDKMILTEVKEFASTLNLTPLSVSFPTTSNNMSQRRLRIGYVSPDFRNHCQSFFTIPLLSNHDHAQFEIYCYAELAEPDHISKRLRTYCDAWRNTHLKSDQQVADMIAKDGIDILIDLTMHMAKGRPRLFALKPAPVQIAWLAYPGTTGLPAIGYRLTDPWLDPPGIGDDHYTEISIRLPDTFWCYDPLQSDLYPNTLPALTAGYVTFGCLNNFCKVSDDTLCRWGEVMSRVPSSRLILLAPAGRHRQRIFDILGRYDIAAERIEIVELQPRFQYLQTYHRTDICLDTLPYNGHTTSLDAFWMGVPVVSQVGHTVAGRAGWSQLNNLGLTELAAFDDQTFIDIAIALATDLPRLSHLRQTLRSNLEASPLMDGKRFAKAIETAYSQIWQSSPHFGGALTKTCDELDQNNDL